MAQFILKDSKGKEQTFDHETIYVRDTNGELVQFKQGEGDIPAVVQPFEVTENGTYTAPDGVDGYSPVTVNVPAPEIVLQDKTITENGEYTADEGYDGLGKVLVEVASSGSETKFKSASFTAKGTWNEKVTINFGFKPDFLFVFAGSGGSSAVSIGTSNFLFKGGSQKWKDMFGSAYFDYYYVSSGKIYAGRGSSAYVIDSTDTNCPINQANENGFNFGVTHASGSYNVLAIGL